MNCPSDQTRLSALLGELSVNEARALETHRAGCARCRQALRADEQLLSDLAAAPELPRSDVSFTADVMAACAAASPATPRQRARMLSARTPESIRARSRQVMVWSGALALAACAAALLLVLPWRMHATDFQARGASTGATPVVSADVLLVRDGAFHPVSGARLHEGDALAVRYTNAGDVPKYLAVFALDAQRELHWIYPAYVDEAANPSSVALAPEVRGQLLSEVVEPEAPAEGELRVFAVVTNTPIYVKDVEAMPRRQLDSNRIEAAFSSANVQTWRATWTRK